MSLAAELADLYRMGKVELPKLSAHYYQAEADARASCRLSAFVRSGGLGSGGTYGAGTELQALVDAFVDILGQEANDLRSMGVAVARCADDYLATDDAAAQAAYAHEKKLAGL
jgi:hypothetical protein